MFKKPAKKRTKTQFFFYKTSGLFIPWNKYSRGRLFYFHSVGLDPDEPEFFDPEQFNKLSWFLDKECDASEREDILSKCIPCMALYALKLKEFKPPGGVHFSLQQQGTRKLNLNLDKNYFSSFCDRVFPFPDIYFGREGGCLYCLCLCVQRTPCRWISGWRPRCYRTLSSLPFRSAHSKLTPRSWTSTSATFLSTCTCKSPLF
jgi:hypothetical protein